MRHTRQLNLPVNMFFVLGNETKESKSCCLARMQCVHLYHAVVLGLALLKHLLKVSHGSATL